MWCLQELGCKVCRAQVLWGGLYTQTDIDSKCLKPVLAESSVLFDLKRENKLRREGAGLSYKASVHIPEW